METPVPKKIDLNAPHMLAANLECKFGTGSQVDFMLAGKLLLSDDKSVLPALARFDGPTAPITVLEYMQQLGGDLTLWRMRLMKWVACGLLQPSEGTQLAVAGADNSYDGIGGVLSCLNDRTRTLAALEGIARTVRKGDNVVDIGTGSGILAFAALRAGATHVYAIEPSPAASLAQALAEENGLANRLTVLRAYSSDIELPVKCDVMISELVSQDPFSEDMLGVTADARARLLKPEARIVPAQLTVYAQLVSTPEHFQGHEWPTAEKIGQWHKDFGFSFNAVAELATKTRKLRDRQRAGQGELIRPKRAADLRAYSEAVPVANIDFAHDDLKPTGEQHWTANLTATASAAEAAILTFYELDYGGGSLYCNGPSATIGATMRNPRLFTDKKPLTLEAGQVVPITFSRKGKASTLRVTEPG
ncbi:MAG TPA: hypothetical protein DIW43_12595 [Spongiibacteraceae bacterium]|nr:hypothetical protein [Spongiibacteraceae bacterium]HCS28289.1 hypothetical protein [Spongiibacteraceae bacterium]